MDCSEQTKNLIEEDKDTHNGGGPVKEVVQ